MAIRSKNRSLRFVLAFVLLAIVFVSLTQVLSSKSRGNKVCRAGNAISFDQVAKGQELYLKQFGSYITDLDFFNMSVFRIDETCAKIYASVNEVPENISKHLTDDLKPFLGSDSYRIVMPTWDINNKVLEIYVVEQTGEIKIVQVQ